ncbi:MAG: branched-chain amino acid ABC transporter permease [Planctomycetes bacterium]|nr:branched-chain amino acid ABC transporter permease [Planctomycetota bacterium]
MAIAIAIAAVAPPLLQAFGQGYHVSILIFTGIFTIVAVGLCLLMGYAGQISLGHAGFFGIGAYVSGILTTRAAIHPALALVAAVALAAAVAGLVGIPTLRLRGHYLAMATLGFGEIVYVILNAAGSLTGGPSGLGEIPSIVPRFDVLGMKGRDVAFYAVAWATVFAAIAISARIVDSRVGRALRAVHTSERAAMAMGIDAARLKLQVFVLSAMFAAIAGSYYAHYVTFISPTTFGVGRSIRFLTIVAVGGMANLWGVVGASTLLGVLTLAGFFGKEDMIVYGALLVAAMVWSAWRGSRGRA